MLCCSHMLTVRHVPDGRALRLPAALHSCAGVQADSESGIACVCGLAHEVSVTAQEPSVLLVKVTASRSRPGNGALVFLKAAVHQHELNNFVGSVISVLQIQELLCWFLGFEVYF